tara:strand:+ start:2615 stop:3253 length:639 start_codon:yes stop_codon:yes gene_type:complete
LSKAKSIRFSDIINIHRPFVLALKSALRLGIVVKRFFAHNYLNLHIMEHINIKEHTKESLTFIFYEADKHFSSVIDAVKANSNRSFFLFGLYLSIASFSFSEVIELKYEYLILLVGCVVSAIFLLKNISPTIIEISGSSPSDILVPYFSSFKKEELEMELLATQIESYNESIRLNKILVSKMSNRYIWSFKILLFFILVFIFVFSFFLFKSN